MYLFAFHPIQLTDSMGPCNIACARFFTIWPEAKGSFVSKDHLLYIVRLFSVRPWPPILWSANGIKANVVGVASPGYFCCSSTLPSTPYSNSNFSLL